MYFTACIQTQTLCVFFQLHQLQAGMTSPNCWGSHWRSITACGKTWTSETSWAWVRSCGWRLHISQSKLLKLFCIVLLFFCSLIFLGFVKLKGFRQNLLAQAFGPSLTCRCLEIHWSHLLQSPTYWDYTFWTSMEACGLTLQIFAAGPWMIGCLRQHAKDFLHSSLTCKAQSIREYHTSLAVPSLLRILSVLFDDIFMSFPSRLSEWSLLYILQWE